MARRITHLLTHRVAIGMVMRRLREPLTERQIGIATGLDLTTIHTSLREMELLKLATREAPSARFRNGEPKSVKFVWTLTALGRGEEAA